MIKITSFSATTLTVTSLTDFVFLYKYFKCSYGSYTVLNEYNIIVNKYVYGGIFMITSTWNWMWEQHDRVKDLFRFFTTANKDDMPTGTNNHHSKTTGGGNGGNYYRPAQLIGLIAGPLLFVLTLLFVHPEGLSSEGLAVLASTIWIAIWWMTEAIPIPATSLLPIILFPITKGLDIDATTSAYGNDT